MINIKYLVLLFLVYVSLWLSGCVSQGSHVFIDTRGNGGRGGGGGEEPGVGPSGIPLLEDPVQVVGSGGMLSNSENFRSYGGAVQGGSSGTSEGEIYRMVNPRLGVGQQRLTNE
jgi:hypothetical protein